MRRTIALLNGFVILLVPSVQEAPPAVPTSLTTAVRDELRGKVALDHIYQIATHHRSVGSRGYHEAALYVAEAAKRAGLQQVETLRFPADGGKTKVLDTYQTSYAWEIRGGEAAIEGDTHPFCRYEDIPTCIVEYSSSVNAVAELIDVGQGTNPEDYVGKNVRGKFVLASGPASSVVTLAQKSHGAIGVVSAWRNFAPDRSPFPDQVPWQAVPGDINDPLVGFSVSARTAADLRQRLSRGPVTVRARIEARLFDGEVEVVSGVIPGTTLAHEEVLLTAHLNHHRPGANDNASGCGLNLEIAQVLTRLILEGRMSRPRRTIRFLWFPEHRGPQLYLDRFRDYRDRGVAVINNDMVGEDQQECNSVFVLVRTPDSLPSYLNDLLAWLAEDVVTAQFRSPFGSRNLFHYRVGPYSGGISDHYYFVEGSIRIPALLLNFTPDNYYHSNEDTPDHCDATSLMRVGYIGAVAAAYLASAGIVEGRVLARITATAALVRAADAFQNAIAAVSSANDLARVYRAARNRLVQTNLREQAAVRSVSRLDSALAQDVVVERLARRVGESLDADIGTLDELFRESARGRGIEPRPSPPTPDESRAASIVPRRKLYGPLRTAYFNEHISAARRAWYAEGRLSTLQREEILNFIDGRRTVMDISNAVAAEFGNVGVSDVLRYLEDVAFLGFVEGIDAPRVR